MNLLTFLSKLENAQIEFFTGVPDSQLKPLCDYLVNDYGISDRHIIAANEGNCVALAAGYYLATGKVPCVYMQNSGFGNVINPLASLLNPKVYGIPCAFVIGWRGEPGVMDEPQHVYQGEITLELLKTMDVAYMILDKNTTETDLEEKMVEFKLLLDTGKSVAFVVKKGGLSYNEKAFYENNHKNSREDIISIITEVADESIIVSTTGKTSRELFEIRERKGQSHKFDFLTVGSMGHSSSIALGISMSKPNAKVWCVDGDGAALMHMGSMAVIGAKSPNNFIHIVINNGAHESVGGQPTVADKISFSQIALGCGYKKAYTVEVLEEFRNTLEEVKQKDGPVFIEIKSAIGSREDLGRPTTTPAENKGIFMDYLKDLDGKTR